MVSETRDAADGFEIDDRERTPQSKTKGSTAVLRKSPNNVFSPLSIMSEATALGDKSFDSSFSDEHVTDGTVKRDFSSQPAGVDAPSSIRDDVEVGVSMSLTSTVGDEDEEDLSHSWLRRRRVSVAVAPALSANAPLLTSLAPSTDEAMIHRRVSELRIALRAAEGALEKTRARFEDSESARHEAESESAALRARVWTLEGAEALSGARLHDGTLDLLRGELLNEATAELEEAARAAADAEACARDAVASLRQAEDTAAAVVSAANAEVESLSLEAAQARFRAQAESRATPRRRERRERVRMPVEQTPRRRLPSGATSASEPPPNAARRRRPPGLRSRRRKRPERLPRRRRSARRRRRSITSGCKAAFTSWRTPRAPTRARTTAPSFAVCVRSSRWTPRRRRTRWPSSAPRAASSRRNSPGKRRLGP